MSKQKQSRYRPLKPLGNGGAPVKIPPKTLFLYEVNFAAAREAEAQKNGYTSWLDYYVSEIRSAKSDPRTFKFIR